MVGNYILVTNQDVMMAKMVSKYILVGNCTNDQKLWSEDYLAKSDRLTMVWIKWNLL